MSVIVGTLTMDLYVSDALTLKDKRQVVKSLLGRVGNRFNVSVAEVDRLDNRQHATLAVAAVANSREHVDRVLNAVLRFCDSDPRAEVTKAEIETD
ncbi:MAG TPA: DUF503 domain-containing protein [Armatimonadota bacterium]|nr:DUF503 domain-containing protein [Armatimonadota bacterium]